MGLKSGSSLMTCLRSPLLDVGLRWTLRGHGVREGMDGGFPLSWYLGVRVEREGGGLLWSCSGLVREGWKGHGLIHGRKDIDHAIRAPNCGLILMIVMVVVVMVLMLMEMPVFVLVVQDQLMVVFMGLPLFVTVLVVMVLPLVLTVLMGFGVMCVSVVMIVRVGVSMAHAMFVCVVVA